MGKKPHRYRKFRALTQGVSLLVLALVPGLLIARVDLFGDAHAAWTQPADFLHGLVAVGVSIFAFYLFTFQINLVAGRMFCGWGCPIGQLNRLTDTFVAQNRNSARLRWGAILIGFAFLLTAAIGTWWARPSSLWDIRFAPFAWGALLLGTTTAIVFARVFGWSFCRKACPIGLYYSVVQQKRPLGILFDRDSCQDEGACVRACPVALDARNLGALKTGIGGFAIDALTEHSHCLRCGACVEACEIVTTKTGGPALTFGRPDVPSTPTGDLVQIGGIARVVPRAAPAPVVQEPSVDLSVRQEPSFGEVIPPRRIAMLGALGLSIVVAGIAFAIYQRAEVPVEKPTDTAEAPAVVTPPAANNGYHAASTAFAAGTIEGVVRRGGGPTAGTAVWLRDPPAGKPTESKTIEVRITGSAYESPIYVATSGDRIDAHNQDVGLHTFHVSDDTRSLKNVPLPAGRHAPRFAVPRPGMYRLHCDNHPAEESRLVVVDHPYITTTSSDGRFVIEDAPAGTLAIELIDNPTPKEITVTQNETTRVSLDLETQDTDNP